MKTSIKMLVATVAIFAIAFAGIIMSDEADVIADTDAVTGYTEISDEDLELYTAPRPVSKLNDIFDFVIDAEISIVSVKPLDYSCTNISASVQNDKTTGKYTASSIQSDKIDPYDEGLFYNQTTGLFYLKVTAKITFMAQENPLDNKSYSVTGTFMAPAIYDGQDINVTDIIYDGQKHAWSDALSIDGDFTLVYVDGVEYATNADEYSTKVTIKGFERSVPPTIKTWRILPKELKDEYITLDPESIEYNGESQVPDVIAYDNDIGKNLKKKVDYTTNLVSKKDVDTYTVTFTGKGNYYGTVTKTWEITPAPPAPPVPISGTLHVNDVYGNYFSDRSSLEGKIFIFPDEANTYQYGVYGNALDSSSYYVTIKDGWGQLVFTDNPEEEAAATAQGIKASHVTYSEWNWIRIDGTNGYTGSIIGNFTVHQGSNLEIGSKVIENGIVYTVTSLDNKSVSVTGYEEGIASELVIPDFVNGFKVTKIADKAFYGCKTITSLELGDYVTSIGVKAFTNCTKLKSVEFEDSLKTISAYAFYGCTRLADVSMDDSVKTIGSYAFYKCTALKNIYISGALKTLGGNAFSVSFIDADGKGITQTAKNLAGHTFEGSNKVLKLVA